MLGKNNTSLLIQKSAVRKSQFAIKKLSVGVVSVAVGSLLSLGVTSVQAEEVVESDVVLIQDTALIENLQEDELNIAENLMEEEKVSEATNTSATDETLLNHPLIDEVLSADEPVVSYSNENLVLEEDEADETDIKTEELVSENHKDFESESHYEAAVQIEETSLDKIDNELSIILDEAIKDSSEPLIVEEIDNDAKLSSLEAQEAQEALSLSTNKVDIIPPKIISISPGQEFFTGNETRNIFVEIEEANIINYLSLQFINREYTSGSYYQTSNYFDFSYYNNDEGLVRNQNGNYLLELTNDSIHFYGQYAGLYELDRVHVEDNMGNIFDDYIPNVDPSFIYYEYENQDLTDPVLIDVEINKTEFSVGETVNIKVIAEEDHSITNVNIDIYNIGHFGPKYFNLNLSETGVLSKIAENLYEYTASFLLPQNMGPTQYFIQSIGLNNVNLPLGENESEGITFDVINNNVKEVHTEHKTLYTTNSDEVQSGKNGLKYIFEDGTEYIISEVIDEVIQYYAEYVEILVDPIYKASNNLSFKEEIIVDYGHSGFKLVFFDNNGDIVEERIEQSAKPYIIEVGVVEYFHKNPKTIYVDDPWSLKGQENHLQYGTLGEYQRIYDLNWDVAEEIEVFPATDEIISIGTLEPTVIPYETRYTYWDYEVRQGSYGHKYVYPDGTVSVITNPTDEVKLYPYSDLTLHFETIYESNPTEYLGFETIVQVGSNGVQRIFYDLDGNEIYNYNLRHQTPQIISKGTLTNALKEEQVSDPNISNSIKIIDLETGELVDSYELIGDAIYSRIFDRIDRYNRSYSSTLEPYNVKKITETKEKVLHNAEYIDLIHREVEYFVRRNKVITLPDKDIPLIPEQIPIDYDSLSPYLTKITQVNIFNEHDTLMSFDVDLETFNFSGMGLTEQERIIRKSLALLDDKQYYFVRSEMLKGSNLGVLEGSVINIFVRERLSKELVDADYSVEFTNNPQEVRNGKVGKKHLYSNGFEEIIEAPINEVRLTKTKIEILPTIDTISIDSSTYAIDEFAEVTIKGRSKTYIDDLILTLSDWSKFKTFYVDSRLINNNIEYEDGSFTAKLYINLYDTVKNSTFTFDNLIITDKNGYTNKYFTEVSFNTENLTYEITDEPFQVGLTITDATNLGIHPIDFGTEYTTDEQLVREGKNGSKLVYSDGSEVILTKAISEILLYDNEIAEIEPETEYTIYAHEVRAGIKGSKLVFSNGEEKILDAPVSAVALYRNKIEKFDYSTITVESSDLAFGERRVTQEGIVGRRVVFYNVDGSVVDSLVVSAPVSRIEQIGANKQILVLIPFDTQYTTDHTAVRTGQNGTRYTYSDGREEILTQPISAVQLYRYADEVVAYQDVVHENPLLATGQTNVLTQGTEGLNRVFYDQDGQVVEVHTINQAVNRVIEVGTFKETIVDKQPIPTPELPQSDADEDSVPEEPVPDSDSDSNSNSNSDSGTDDDDANTSTPDTDSNEDNHSTNEDDINDLDEDNSEEIESEDVDSKEDEENGNSSPSLPSEKDELDTITPSISLNAASLLPNTGEHTQTVWLTLSALSLLTGLGLVIKGKRKQE
ncbi:G5 domain-containing protein [Fundicoccus sp. Sow4_D5]|uniref:G5 domain-containing protein n=1 Tax=Fundicoccus sp. Sow4_D5 TaxID=3438782 RepID=UPI003F90F252